MGFIESKYRDRMDALEPKKCVASAVSMFRWDREAIARQILSDLGPMSSERLKWMVAIRQYGADPTTRELTQRALVNVPN
jgi:hypothetical protein